MKEKKRGRLITRKDWRTGRLTAAGPRLPHTYRAFRRNAEFGRKPIGNTKPGERHAS